MKNKGWNMRVFKREQRSLFGEILDWMLTPLLLLWPISLALTWLVAQGLADKPFDRALVYNVQALAQQVRMGPDQQVQFSLPQPASELLRADETDLVYYQVLGGRGEHLSGDRDLPLPKPNQIKGSSYQVHIRDDEIRGLEVRVAYTWIQLDVEGTPSALVHGIKPLKQLEERIRERKPDDLSPLDDKAVPMEVAPLLVSVNDLLERLKDSISTQKRFLADAAHQLKTPLAGLRMQADLAQRSGSSEEDLKKSLLQIGRASVQATRTVNQLLSLARAEGGVTHLPLQSCDMAALCRDVLQDCLASAMDKGLDLGYEGVEVGRLGAQVQGNPTLLKEMVRNLVENAIHYTPNSPERQGVITVRVLVDPYSKVLVMQVEDNGPGIPLPERDLVFQPFYRVLGTNVDGSGLGLPIVKGIAQQHGATVSIDMAHPGQTLPGACFTLRFRMT